MCRLFFRAAVATADSLTKPTESLLSPLVKGSASLKRLSHENPGGFGAFTADSSGITIAKRPTAAFADPSYNRTVANLERLRPERREGDVFMEGMHIRYATAGGIGPQNTHPFTMRGPEGETALMMNGNVAGFERHRDAILREVDPDLAAQVAGQTDAEAALALYMTQLRSTAKDAARPEGQEVVDALTGTVRTLAQIANAPGGEKSFMNFVVSNGDYVGFTRYRNTLAVSDRLAPGHTAPLTNGSVHDGIVVASEPWTPGLRMDDFPEATAGAWTTADRRLVMKKMGDEDVLPLGDGPIPA